MMIIDGHTAFSGGINISDEYININSKLGVWKDNGIRIKGEAVWNFTVMFLEMWNSFKKKIMIIINTNINLLKSIRKMVSLYLMGKVH